MSKKQMVREAMEYNRCAILAKRHHAERMSASIAGFKERRDSLMHLARQV